MTDPSEFDHQTAELHERVGQCIMAWAMVEFDLALIWREVSGSEVVQADRVWSTLRSFEAKLQLLRSALTASRDAESVAIWSLLHPHIIKMYDSRNKVAHSTLISDNSKPFL